ncbi:MAG: hypothetical protein GC145_14535 [Caulobacter sp.]|nr:hypothetical protein [Caulobacter sp.]
MDRLSTIRDGRNAARHLRQLAKLGAVTPLDLDRLMGKIDDALETATDIAQLLPPPAAADFAETLARMVAKGLPLTRGSLLNRSVPTSAGLLDDFYALRGDPRPRPSHHTMTRPSPEEIAARRGPLLDWSPPQPVQADNAYSAAPDRMRTVRGLGVIDGGRP